MNCNESIRLMHDYFDNELDGYSYKKLFNHLDECDKCRLHFNELKETNAYLKNYYKSNIKSPDYKQRLLFEISKNKKENRFKKYLAKRPTYVAASIFVLLFTISIFSYYIPENDLKIVSNSNDNLIVSGNNVIVPEDKSIIGDILIENGNLEIKGKVSGDVTVINGNLLMANASNVDGRTKQVDQFIEWILYQVRNIF